MRRLGIDIGSIYLGVAVLEDGLVKETHYGEHKGSIASELRPLLDAGRFGRFDVVGVTGSLEGRDPRLIDNSLAVIEGVRFLLPVCRNVFVVGGQSFSLLFFDEDGRYAEHSVNPPCAAGTGSFIEQQAERLRLSVGELGALAEGFQGKVPAIATRCAVFAKTDIIHAMQEGYPLAAICAGLCDGLARSVTEALVKGRALEGPLGLVGGVSRNHRMASAMQSVLGQRLNTPKHAELAGAIGAAVLARDGDRDARWLLEGGWGRADGVARRNTRPALPRELADYPDFSAFSITQDGEVEVFRERRPRRETPDALRAPPPARPEEEPRRPPPAAGGLHLGIDIGSTSTKAVALTAQEEIVCGFYTATKGDPIGAVQRLMAAARGTLGPGALELLGVCTTGSGRRIVKSVFGADMEVNEITAHAEAALYLHPQADTIIELGGQDAKFTLLKDGDVTHAAMNYVCAAGTGSFIEEQAKRLGIGLGDFAELAFGAEAPFTSDRCTVYMERDLSSMVAEGWSKGALAAAVLNSVRDNYLAKVVGHTPIGQHVVFQGATARNRALVAAFESQLGRPVHVSPYCHLAGALGAALLSRRGGCMVSKFNQAASGIQVEPDVCRCCANHCVLTVVSGESGRSGFGMKCGKDYDSPHMARRKPSAVEDRFRKSMTALYGAAVPAEGSPRSADASPEGRGAPQAGSVRGARPPASTAPRPANACPDGGRDARLPASTAPRKAVRVGVPAVLYGFEYAPLWARFLSKLGFTVVHGEPSRRALAAGRRVVNSDFCSPMVLAHGCVEELLRKKVDFVFSPAVVNERDPLIPASSFRKKTTDSYFCYYSQYLATIVDKLTTMNLGGRLISPLLMLHDRSVEQTSSDLHRELSAFFPGLEPGAVEEAFRSARSEFDDMKAERRKNFARALARPAGGVRIALMGHPYVALEPALNLDLPRQLEARGAEVFWQDEFDLEDFDPACARRHLERMHWRYGKIIVKLAEYVARTDGLFAVFVSSFRCSPDSFLMSYVKDVMSRYGKPFLVLQLDELSSDVGYATRIEAALRSFKAAARRGPRRSPAAPTALLDGKPEPGDTVLVSQVDRLISGFWGDCFTAAGYRSILLDADERALSTGYRYASGGECMPLVAIAGGAVNKVRDERLDPSKVFLYLPTVCMACNFPQFPVFCGLAFDAAGLGGVKVGLINWLSAGDHFSLRVSARVVHSYIVGCILHKLYHRSKPYEARPGAADSALAAAEKEIRSALLARKDLRPALSSAAAFFRRVERRRTAERKPRIALVGDMYVKYNGVVNQRLQDLVLELGGELVMSSFSEYPLHFLDVDSRLYGENWRAYGLLRGAEQEFEAIAGDLLGDQGEPDFIECRAALEDYKIKHYIPGETSINVGRVLYYIKRRMIDAVIHVNPMFCCPGVVSASIFRKVQEDFGIPVIDIFYDGTGNPNRLLIPHLHYLPAAMKAARPLSSLDGGGTPAPETPGAGRAS
ncbi:MAG: hypothetical protein HY927_06995 [Elusimicrobia bacterium]|nr:hypothetical protein [Elusimicrobiota bacterium]